MTNLPSRLHWVAICSLLFKIRVFDRTFLLNINLELGFGNKKNRLPVRKLFQVGLELVKIYYYDGNSFH